MSEDRVRVQFLGDNGSSQFTGTLPKELIDTLPVHGLLAKHQRIFMYVAIGVDNKGRIHTFREVPAPIPVASLLRRS